MVASPVHHLKFQGPKVVCQGDFPVLEEFFLEGSDVDEKGNGNENENETVIVI